jgi:hypothetical protein
LDLPTEKRHLAIAVRDIAEGEERIQRQLTLLDTLRQRGQNLTEAEHLLQTLRQTLQTWEDHRDLIVQAIARLESAPAGHSVPPTT